MLKVIIAGVIILLLILTTLLTIDVTGFWKVSPEFARDAGLNKLILYVRPKKNGIYQSYLYMENSEGAVLENQQIELRINTKNFTNGYYPGSIIGSNTMDNVDAIKVSQSRGILTLIDRANGVICAEFYKDMYCSDIARSLN